VAEGPGAGEPAVEGVVAALSLPPPPQAASVEANRRPNKAEWAGGRLVLADMWNGAGM